MSDHPIADKRLVIPYLVNSIFPMNLPASLSSEQQTQLKAALDLARTCNSDTSHAEQVTRLALRLFDELQSIHKLGDAERFYLLCAGILHDIGWTKGWKGHHKESLRIILDTSLLPFNSKERLIIGTIARYHRSALPSLKHDHYAALEPAERRMTDLLAACLRLADGLDCTHQQRVRDLKCKVDSKKILVYCAINTLAPEEIGAAQEKKDLMEVCFRRKVSIRCQSAL